MPRSAGASGRSTLASEPFAPHPGLEFDETGAPFDPVYRDIFRSRGGAWQESQAVFVDGCRLREGWRGAERFTVLELGFGLGINFLATLHAWRIDPARSQRLHMVSIEAHPLSRADLERGLFALACAPTSSASPATAAAGPERAAIQALLDAWPLPLPGLHRIEFEGGAVTLTLAFGDAARIVPKLALAADAIYLDGFSPARNPRMWQAPLLKALARLARSGARLSTWSAAAPVRDALVAAGFEVSRVPGHGGKRHRIEAVLSPRRSGRFAAAEPPPLGERKVLVIGAGLAGAALADGFARRGFAVELLDSLAAPGGEASAQPICSDHMHLSIDDNPLARLTRAALLLRCARADPAGLRMHGKLMLDADEAEARQRIAMLARLGWTPAFARHLRRDEASGLAGLDLPRGGLWLPLCTSIAPGEAIAAWIGRGAPAIVFHGGARVERLSRAADGSHWVAFDDAGHELVRAPIAVLANAGDAQRLGALGALPAQRLRGQTTWLRDRTLAGLRIALGGCAYLVPAGAGGRALVGASYAENGSTVADPRDDLGNLQRLGQLLGRPPASFGTDFAPAAIGFRFALTDHLPAIGALPDLAATARIEAELIRNDRLPIPPATGLYGAFGFGSRGLLWSALAAELLPAIVCGEPAPIERELIAAIAPDRFLRKRLRHGQRAGD